RAILTLASFSLSSALREVLKSNEASPFCTSSTCKNIGGKAMAREFNDYYDLLVIGAGAAGSTAAHTAASQGKRVALVERDKIGGTCLNYGCDPTKTLLNIAAMLYQAHHSDRYGLRIPAASLDWGAAQVYMREVTDQI